MALCALVATPARALRLALPGLGWPATIALAVAAGAALAFGVWRHRGALAAALERAAARLGAAPARTLAIALPLGLGLRLAWSAAARAPFQSDGLAYVALAERLASGAAYATPLGEVAFWPPGYPLFLAPLIVVGGARAAVITGNLILFGLLVAVTWWLGRSAWGPGATALAVLGVAVWPNLVALAAVPAKELLVAVLLPAALGLLGAAERSAGHGRAAVLALAAGAALGAATLTQPAMTLLVLPLAAHSVAATRARRDVLVVVPCLLAGMLALIAPWMWRNQRLLGVPVLGTAVGSVFYSANNERATGDTVVMAPLPFAGLPELERSRRTFALGRAWVLEHPAAFLSLAARKLVVFFGDDGVGVYHSLRDRLRPAGGYALAKAIAMGFWWLLWAGVLLAVCTRGRALGASPEVLAWMLVIVYLAAMNAVFEAGGRHHVPLAAGIALLSVSAAARLPAGARAGESAR